MALPVYCTVEDVKRAFDQQETARNDARLWRAIDGASRLVENDCHRRFYPWTGTRYFTWPTVESPTPWRLWLGPDDLVSISALTAGGVTISTANVYLEPNDIGPPYTAIEINRSSSSSFASGATPQRAVAVTGVFGYSDTTETAGTLAAAVSSTSATTVTVSDSSLIGTGDTIVVDSERMLVTKRAMTTTAQTGSITSSTADVTLAVATGSAFAVGEVVLLDSERMLIVDISSNNLTVKRAFDGSVLATHSTATIYAPRLLTVQRGLTGSTAATHSNGAAVSRQTVPGPVRDYTIAIAEDRFLQETAGYARNVLGRGDSQRLAAGGALPGLKAAVIAQYSRARLAAI